MNTGAEHTAPATDLHTVPRDEWPARSHIEDPSGTPPRLDPELIPDALRPWIADEAERLGVLPEQILVPAMIGLAALAGNRFRIQPKRVDDSYVVPANLAGVMISPPAGYKTPAIRAGLRFVRSIDNRRSEEHAGRAPKTRGRQKAIRSKIEGVEKALKDLTILATPTKVEELTTDLEQLETETRRHRTRHPVSSSTTLRSKSNLS